MLDDDVRAAARELAHAGDHILGIVVHAGIGAELTRPGELVVARGGHDRSGSERFRNLERRRRDAASDPPDEHPFARVQPRPRDEHPVRRLEDEREGGCFLEAQAVGDGVDRLARNCDELGVRPVAMLAEHMDAVRVREARVDHDALARSGDHARPVRTEDPRLRHRRHAPPKPDVEVVQRGSSELDQNLPGARHRIRHLLVAQNLGAALLVDPDRLHAVRLDGRESREPL